METLPYEDNKFDAVIINQVVHHLDDMDKDENFPGFEHVVKEFYRVLKPGGKLLINHSYAD